MDSPVKDLLDKLHALDLATYPAKEAQNLIENLRGVAYHVYTLPAGTHVTRVRVGENFYSKCNLSYVPQQFKKEYSRASIPNTTMFYGVVTPNELYLDRVLMAAYEVSPLLNSGSKGKGCEKITFSDWLVIKDINLMIIAEKSSFDLENATLSYSSGISPAFPKDYPLTKSDFLAIMDFLAEEFSKKIINKDYEYLLSAIFSTLISDENEPDGILYPPIHTVEMLGYNIGELGSNVAIKPKIADNNLMLTFVEERTVYKNGNKVFCNSDKICEPYENQTHFVYVDSPTHHPEEACLKEIGVDNMQDLLQ